MGLALPSEPQVAFAVAASVVALASAALLLAAIAVLRAHRRWRLWRLSRREAAFREALHSAIDFPNETEIPPISDLELPYFIERWTRLHESLKGQSAENLSHLLTRYKVDDRLLAMLRRRSMRLKLIAITALGHLREARAWDELVRHSHSPSPVLSFAAARALLRIDPRRALDLLAPAIATREDWSLARLGAIFRELGPAVVTPTIVNLLVRKSPQGLDRVLRLARFARRERVSAVVRGWLIGAADPDVILPALDFVEDARDLKVVRGAARHADWKVRMAAARALGRIGAQSELALLLDLLRDPVWWVRHHAARSLTVLHGLPREDLEKLRDGARDAFAADMLREALAAKERGA